MATLRNVTAARRAWRRGALLALPAGLGLAALALLVPGGGAPEAQAYSNCKEPDFMTGGPHRTINELALEHFFDTLPPGDPRAAFKRVNNCKVRGPMVVGRSDLIQVVEAEKTVPWQEWVIQGGFSADEPEIYNSFRHFYDPLSLNPNPRYPGREEGVPYLTDHLEQIRDCLKLMRKRMEKHESDLDFIEGRLSWYADVQVDARDWAVNGSKGQGYWENAYCWNKGVGYFRTAFTGQDGGKALSVAECEKRFAQAWRALGETMHLLADMCCPPHVRNDSHPGVSAPVILYSDGDISLLGSGPNVGVLRNDAYELWCQEALIRQVGALPVPPNIEATLRNVRTPMDLFHQAATFTNRNFFSSDTVPHLIPGKAGFQMANGCKPYPQPGLETLEQENGYYVATILGRRVRLCHRSWLLSSGWGAASDAQRITMPCVEDQAAILIPLAKSALARLVDWFLPKLTLDVEGYDANTKRLALRVKHTPYGAFPEEMIYSDPQPTCRLFFGRSIQDWKLYTVSVKDGGVVLDLSQLAPRPGASMAVELDIGGLRLRAEVSEAPKIAPRFMAIECSIKGTVEKTIRNDWSPAMNCEGARRNETLDITIPRVIPVTVAGAGFQGEHKFPGRSGSLKISGQFAPDMRSIKQLTLEEHTWVKDRELATGGKESLTNALSISVADIPIGKGPVRDLLIYSCALPPGAAVAYANHVLVKEDVTTTVLDSESGDRKLVRKTLTKEITTGHYTMASGRIEVIFGGTRGLSFD